jgi:hypothetical protein
MQTPTTDNTFETLTDLTTYHISMLKTDPKTTDMVEDIQNVYDDIKTKNNEYATSVAQNITHLALRVRADNALDKTISRFNYKVLGFVSGNRKSSIYRQIFPKGLSAIVSAPFTTEITRAMELVNTVDKLDVPAELKSFTSEITTATMNLQQAVDNYKESSIQKSKSSLETNIAKENWIRQYRANYGTIISIYPDDKKEVELFFKRFRSNRKTPDTE